MYQYCGKWQKQIVKMNVKLCKKHMYIDNNINNYNYNYTMSLYFILF